MRALSFFAEPLTLSAQNDNGAVPVVLLRPANDCGFPMEAA